MRISLPSSEKHLSAESSSEWHTKQLRQHAFYEVMAVICCIETRNIRYFTINRWCDRNECIHGCINTIGSAWFLNCCIQYICVFCSAFASKSLLIRKYAKFQQSNLTWYILQVIFGLIFTRICALGLCKNSSLKAWVGRSGVSRIFTRNLHQTWNSQTKSQLFPVEGRVHVRIENVRCGLAKAGYREI